MRSETEHRKLAAIMFTDMVGYSALAQRNEAQALELLEEHRRLLRSIFPKHQGTEIKTIGDGFLVEFSSALAAVNCALEIQRALNERNQTAPQDMRIFLRIGIYVGDVVWSEGDVHGDGVNIAARIEPLAEPGGICISEDVARQVQNKLSQTFVKFGPAELKNIQLPVVVFKLVLDGTAAAGASRRKEPRRKQMVTLLYTLLVAIPFIIAIIVFLPKDKPQPDAANKSTNPKPATRITSLAVKPLDDFSGDTNKAYLSDGMTEALCAALGNISALRVPGRSTVMHYKSVKKTIPEMAKELNVDAIIEGSIQQQGNRILITVQLVEGVTDRHMWSAKYDRELSDFFKVQSEVAEAIANEVHVRLTPQDQTRLKNAPTARREVIEAYLSGRWHLARRTAADLTDAIAFFEKAIALDASYAPGHAGLASAYTILPYLVSVPGTNAAVRAKAAAEKALRLDSNSAEAHSALAYVQCWADRDWTGSEASFRKAIAANPNFAQPHHWYGFVLSWQGRAADALREIQEAVRLEPNSEIILANHGLILGWSGDLDKGIEVYERGRQRFPDFRRVNLYLGVLYLARGDYAKAVTILEMPGGESDDHWQALLGAAYARAGRRDEALEIMRRLEKASVSRYVRPYAFAILLAWLGDKDRAFERLYAADRDRDPWASTQKVSLELLPLRDDPRFAAFLKKIGLDK